MSTARPQAPSKSTPSQGSSENTQQGKRKRDQDEDEVDGESAKNKTARVTRNATAEAAEAGEGETIRQTSDDQELSLADLAEAVPALKKMHAQMKGGKRQASKRRSGDKFKLNPSMLEVFADRYLAAQNAHKGVDYQRLSTTKYLKDFMDHAEELRTKEPELKVLLKMALAEQREIDAGEPMDNIEALKEEIAMLDVQHNEDVAKCKQLEVGIKQKEEQHSLTISKLKESYEVEIGKLQNELNEVKAKNNTLKEVVTGHGKSAELGGEVNQVKDKVAKLDKKMEAGTTRQAELVVFSNRLAEEERRLAAEADALKAELERLVAEAEELKAERERLVAEADDLKAGRESVKDEWAKRGMEKSRYDLRVRTTKQSYADCNQRAIDTANDDRDDAIKNAEYLRYELDQVIKRVDELKMKLDSYAACCDTEHCIETFLEKRYHDYLKMSRLEQCRVVVEKIKKNQPERRSRPGTRPQ